MRIIMLSLKIKLKVVLYDSSTGKGTEVFTTGDNITSFICTPIKRSYDF